MHDRRRRRALSARTTRADGVKKKISPRSVRRQRRIGTPLRTRVRVPYLKRGKKKTQQKNIHPDNRYLGECRFYRRNEIISPIFRAIRSVASSPERICRTPVRSSFRRYRPGRAGRFSSRSHDSPAIIDDPYSTDRVQCPSSVRASTVPVVLSLSSSSSP